MADDSDRGQSIALNYVLVLSIAAILVGGLIIAGTSFVDNQRDTVIEGELNVIGTHISGNLQQVDRYVNASHDGTEAAAVNQTFQQQVTGESYTVELSESDGDGPPQLELFSRTADARVQMNVSVNTSVEDSQAQGGTISAYYNDDGNLVIGND